MNILEEIERAIKEGIPDAEVEVSGGGGHFSIVVTSKVFEGKRTLKQHQIVLQSIKELMKGDNAPVHAVDSLICKIPT
tara:strand:- start:22 stop:255 length:234 start_codon:yes stop_codon:yes gene_type:complete